MTSEGSRKKCPGSERHEMTRSAPTGERPKDRSARGVAVLIFTAPAPYNVSSFWIASYKAKFIPGIHHNSSNDSKSAFLHRAGGYIVAQASNPTPATGAASASLQSTMKDASSSALGCVIPDSAKRKESSRIGARFKLIFPSSSVKP